MFRIKIVENIKTHILCPITFFRKSCHFLDNVKKYGNATQATDDNVTRSMHFTRRITKATDTLSEYVILLFHSTYSFANAPLCYFIRKFPVFYFCVLLYSKNHGTTGLYMTALSNINLLLILDTSPSFILKLFLNCRNYRVVSKM